MEEVMVRLFCFSEQSIVRVRGKCKLNHRSRPLHTLAICLRKLACYFSPSNCCCCWEYLADFVSVTKVVCV